MCVSVSVCVCKQQRLEMVVEVDSGSVSSRGMCVFECACVRVCRSTLLIFLFTDL